MWAFHSNGTTHRVALGVWPLPEAPWWGPSALWHESVSPAFLWLTGIHSPGAGGGLLQCLSQAVMQRGWAERNPQVPLGEPHRLGWWAWGPQPGVVWGALHLVTTPGQAEFCVLFPGCPCECWAAGTSMSSPGSWGHSQATAGALLGAEVQLELHFLCLCPPRSAFTAGSG